MTADPTVAAADGADAADAPVAARARPRIPAVVSASLAPVGMIGGWTTAAALQAASFDPVRDTISALATSTATHGWVMTTGLAVTGACHLVTAAGLRGVPTPARGLLAVGGAGTLAVAALPVDVAPGAHGLAAGVAFVALAVWPAAAALGRRRTPPRPAAGPAGAPGRRWSAVAAVVLTGLLVWFVLELQGGGPAGGAHTGLSERVLAGAQSVWPLVVVVARRRAPTA